MNHEHEQLKMSVRAFTDGLREFQPSSLSKPLIDAIMDCEAFKQMELLSKKTTQNHELSEEVNNER